MTIIEKIRAKIEQMLHSIENCPFISGELGAREKEMGEVMAYKNILSILSDLEKEEKPKRVLTLEKEFDGYNSIVVTLDKYVLEGIGIGRHDKVIIKIQIKED